MEDCRIVDLYWSRDERAIAETRAKYERMLLSLSYSLLSSHPDAEECVSDTYFRAWNAMPDARPTFLGAFLAKITRRLSLDRYRALHSAKRGGIGNATEELGDAIPSDVTVESEWDRQELTRLINRFLGAQTEEKRTMFVKRYFYAEGIEQIAREMHLTAGAVKVTLHRMRMRLKQLLETEGLL